MGFLSDIVSGIGNIVTGDWGDALGDFTGLFDDGSDFLSQNSGALSSAAGAQLALQGQRETNSNMKSMFDTNIGWQGQSQQNAFSHDREMATAQMAFQDNQSKTQYQRATADMQAAGLNPILAASRGGNAAQTGSAPTSGGSGGSSIPQLGNKAAAGLAGAASAASISNMAAQNELIQAQTRNVDAQTDTERNRPENTRADTALKTSSARELDERAKKIIAEVKDILPAQSYNLTASAALASITYNLRASENLTELERARLVRAQTKLRELDIPESHAYSEMYKTPFGQKIPYIREGEKFVNSAAGAVRDLGGYQQRKRFNDYVIEGK